MKSNKVVPEPVRILCAANAAYAGPLCVMLVSLLINCAKNRKIEIYVLATNLPDEDRRKIEKSIGRNCASFDLGNLHWLSPDMAALQELHVDGWAEIEVYARLLSSRILPNDFNKVLYLDSDTVILSDVSPLYDSPCDGIAVLAVRDQIGCVSGPEGVFNYKDLGIPPQTHYFNSGVMLINLQYWRKQSVADRVLDYLKLHQASVYFWDQGGLNAILHDSWAEIDPTWNQTRLVLDPRLWQEQGRAMEDWKRTINQPKIVHYSGSNKPWNVNSYPGYSYFFKYLAKTSYRNAFKGPRLERIIGFKLNYFLGRAKVFLLWKRSPKDILRILKRLVSA